jgi:hypothetical protein
MGLPQLLTKSRKFCPNCGALAQAETPAVEQAPVMPVASVKAKKPIYKKWWFWVIIAVVAIGIIGSVNGGNESSTNTDNGSSVVQSGDETNNDTTDNKTDSNKITVIDFSAMNKADIENWATTNKVTVKFSEEYSDSIASGSVVSQSKKANETVKEGGTINVVISKGKKPSIEYQNALKKAESYSKLMHMSKQKIYDQLTSEYGEKFPADAAQYAIDNLNVDYKANALEKADSYSKTMHMSKQKIFDQLTSEYGEKFTAEEAQYAVDNLKADYKANALEKAKSYQQTMSMSKDRIYSQLTSEYGEKFTAEEAQYAIDHLDD